MSNEIILLSDDEDNINPKISKKKEDVIKKKIITIPTVVLNDDGDDDELKLNRQFDSEKSIVVKPEKSNQSNNNLQKVNLNNSIKQINTVVPLIKCKNIEQLKSFDNNCTPQSSKSIEINHSTNLFILNSNQCDFEISNIKSLNDTKTRKRKRCSTKEIVKKICCTEQKTDVILLESDNEDDAVKVKEKSSLFPVNENMLPLPDIDEEEVVKIETDIDKVDLISDSEDNTVTTSKLNQIKTSEKTEEINTQTDNNIKVNVTEIKTIEQIKNHTDQLSQTDQIFDKFLELCTSETIPEKYRKIKRKHLDKIRGYYDTAALVFIGSNQFRQLLLKKIECIELMPAKCVVEFSEVFKELKSNCSEPDKFDGDDDDTAVNDNCSKQAKQIHKLEKFMKLLQHKIRALELAEVDINADWDENSVYIQEDRYKKKLNQVFKKLCELRNENPNSDRPTHTKINFQESQYPELNQAITKMYNKKLQFPNCSDVDRCIRSAINKHNLNLTEEKIVAEVKFIFKSLGKKIKRRRQKELYQNLQSFNTDNDIDADPADHDDELKRKLHDSFQLGERKMQELCSMYVDKQDRGEDHEDDENSEESLNEENSD